MLIYNREPQGFIEVWMTNEEQQTKDRKELTDCMSGLLRKNVRA